jgi:glucose/arabinose dehydrogenase
MARCRVALAGAIVASALGGPAHARIFPADLEETVFIEGVEAPTALAWGPDGAAWITGKRGQVWLVRKGEPLRQVASLAVDVDGERGVTGIAVDPDYATNRQVWLYHTTAEAPVHNRLSRFVHGSAELHSETVVLDLPPLEGPFHNGGCLRFARDKTLFVSVGDGGNRAAAPNPRDLRGKILHLNRDGSAASRPDPAARPHPPDPDGSPGDEAVPPAGLAGDARVWACGFRNPWRFNLQPGTETLFIGDVGENGWEELDVGVAGGDYGWPAIEGPEPPNQPGYVYPILSYAHDAQAPNAITAGDHAKPGDLTPEYTGHYFFGDWGLGHLYRVVLDTENRPARVELWATDVVSPVDIQFGPDGALYYVAFAADDVRRIGPRQ